MKDITEILFKHFSATSNEAEEIEVEEWKSHNEREYSVLKKAWLETGEYQIIKFDTEEAWGNVKSQMRRSKESEIEIESENKKLDSGLLEVQKSQEVKIRTINWKKFAVAASIALIVGFSLYLKRELFLDTDQVVACNNTEEVMRITLPDGSEIFANKGAKLSYNEDFTNNRNLSLNGEAFFKVQKDKEHPFVITTKHGNVKVLGTSFNVNSGVDSTLVSVNEGLVEISTKNATTKLSVGDEASLGEFGISNIRNSDKNNITWVAGEFLFEDADISDVVYHMNKYFKEEIKLAANKPECSISADFKNISLGDFLEVLNLTCSVKVKREANQIIIEKD